MKSIAECLSALSRVQLEDAAVQLGLPVQGRATKAELAVLVGAAMPEAILVALATLHTDGLAALERCLNEAVISTAAAKADESLEVALQVLRCFGLAWHGRGGWEVQPTVWEALRNLSPAERETLEALSTADDLMTGMLNLHGMLPISEVQSAVAHLFSGTDAPPDLAAQLERIYHANLDVYVDGERIYLCSRELDDPAWLLDQLASRQGQPPAVFGTMEMMDAARGLPGGHAIYAPLTSWLARHGVDGIAADDLLYDAVYDLLNGNEGFMEMILAAVEVAEGELTPMEQRMFDKLLQAIPRWTLGGHAAEEAQRPSSRPAVPKVRRNDLCPCGSGRKYKNCCGRFQ